jgi:uncharacterized membrane protein
MDISKIIKHIEKSIEALADWASHVAGSPWFLILHLIWFASWIVFEVEPFPFGLLTMIVSLEAILLSGLILSATDRESERDRKVMNRDLRVSLDTQKLLQHMHEELSEIKEYVTGEGEASET